MRTKRKLVSSAGMLGLTLCLAVGLSSQATAAKKKGKSVKNVTVQRTAATAIPPRSADQISLTTVPLEVGGKAKGKVLVTVASDAAEAPGP